jgi:response regulator NasT
MQYLGFTEQQAHKYLEKQAMDKRCTKIEVAQKVIEMYEV